MNEELIKVILKKIEKNGLSYFSALPIEMQIDDKLIKAVLKEYDAIALEYFDSSVINDPNLIAKYFYKYKAIIKYTDVWKNDKTIALKMIKKFKNLNLYRLLSKDLRNDKDIIIALLNNNPNFYEKLSDEIRSDFDIFLVVLNSKKLDRNFIPLKYADENIKNNKDLVFLSINRNSSSFEYASDKLKKDAEVVLYAVNYNLSNINHIDSSFKNDKEFMTRIILKYGIKALEYAGEDILKDKDFAIKLVNNFGSTVYRLLSDDLQNDEEVVLSCIRKEISKLKNNYYISVDLVYSIIKVKLLIDNYEKEVVIRDMINNVINEKKVKNKVLVKE